MDLIETLTRMRKEADDCLDGEPHYIGYTRPVYKGPQCIVSSIHRVERKLIWGINLNGGLAQNGGK